MQFIALGSKSTYSKARNEISDLKVATCYYNMQLLGMHCIHSLDDELALPPMVAVHQFLG